MVQIAIMGLAALRVSQATLGFDPSRTLTFTLELPEARAGDAAQLDSSPRQLLGQIDTVPGVASSSIASRVPIGDREQIVRVTLDSAPAGAPAEMPATAIVATDLGYFRRSGSRWTPVACSAKAMSTADRPLS